jgi:hypothetical protein
MCMYMYVGVSRRCSQRYWFYACAFGVRVYVSVYVYVYMCEGLRKLMCSVVLLVYLCVQSMGIHVYVCVCVFM